MERKIAKAQKRVNVATALFKSAANEVDQANLHLEETLSEADAFIDNMRARIIKAENIKAKAKADIEKNMKISQKLKEFFLDN